MRNVDYLKVIFRTAIALVISINCVACNIWPRISIEPTPAPVNEISRYLASLWMNSDGHIRNDLIKLLIESTVVDDSRRRAEDFGFSCAAPPSRTCEHIRTIRYKLSAVGTPDRGWHETILSIQLKDHADLQTMTVLRTNK